MEAIFVVLLGFFFFSLFSLHDLEIFLNSTIMLFKKILKGKLVCALNKYLPVWA